MVKRCRGYKRSWNSPPPIENGEDLAPRAAVPRYSRELLDETKEVWQPHYREPLTDEDAREIIENVVGFVRVLARRRRENLTRDRSNPKSGQRH